MNSKKVQKGIIFSCEEVKNTIERRAHDLAVKSNQSISFIISFFKYNLNKISVGEF